jgi:hypothetical protein
MKFPLFAAIGTAVIVAGLATCAPAAAAPAQNTASALQAPAPSLKMLGWLNSSTESAVSDSEFRADFAVSMKPGDSIKEISYQNDLGDLRDSRYLRLNPISNSQDSIDQVYSIAKTQNGPTSKTVYVTARGDSWAPNKTGKVTPKVRVTLTSGATLYGDMPVNVVSTSGSEEDRRPVVLTAYDNVIQNQPGHAGKNSQYSWGNVVQDHAAALPGGYFYLDALSSRRPARLGCDVTDGLTYQWLDADNAPATPQQNISITSHTSGWSNSFLPGDVRFSKPGYYKLVAWANAHSSTGAGESCAGVAQDPSDVSQGVQVGSVFWNLPNAMSPDTGNQGTSTLEVDSTESLPADGQTGHIVTATVRDADGNPISGTAVAFTADGGKLSAPQAISDASGKASVTITSTEPGTITVSATVAGKPLAPDSVAAQFSPVQDLPTPLMDGRVALGMSAMALAAMPIALSARRKRRTNARMSVAG